MAQNALASNFIKDPRQEFWGDQSSWPSEAPKYIFAGRAILKLGAKRFGQNWNEGAPATRLMFELPETLNIFTPTHQIGAACELLRRIHEPYRARSSYGFLGSGNGPDFPTREEWEIARSEAKRAAAEAWNAFQPYAAVAYELAEAAKHGEVKTALRPLRGGDLEAQDWHFWNSESAWFRFDTCRVDAQDPFEYFPPGGGTHWIYIEQASFDTLCAGPQEKADIPQNLKQRRQSSKRTPGRKPKYDWEGFFAELLRRYESHPIPDSDYDVEAEMSDWCMDNFRELPASSIQREKIANFRLVLSAMKAGISRE